MPYESDARWLIFNRLTGTMNGGEVQTGPTVACATRRTRVGPLYVAPPSETMTTNKKQFQRALYSKAKGLKAGFARTILY